MLQGINRIGKSWVGRVIVAVMFGFLIISFAVWGIGDIFRGTQRTQVATVGGVDITADAFRTAYQTEYQNLIRRARRSITPDQARALGLEQRVLGRLVSEAAFDHEARALGLGVPDDLVIRTIQADPAFKGPAGQFDRNVFNELLRQSGLSEAQYARDQRFVLMRQQIAEAVSGAIKVPLAMREAVHRFQTERRSADIIRLTPASLGTMPEPTDTQLQAFYDERKTSFRAPEYRSFAAMALDAAAIAKPDAVSDADAKAQYGRVKDSRFGTPERRALQQILFPTKAEAEAAETRVKTGTSFEEIAKERGIDDATLNLGTLARGEMLDPATADAAFALPEGGVSAPIEGRFGTALVRVAKIEAGSLKPYEQVAAEVKGEIARERARDQVQTIHDAIEDQRASAKPLGEIARERGLALVGVANVDRSGLDRAGQKVATIPGGDATVSAVFRSEVGQDNEAVSLPDGGYVWFEVTGTEPGRDRPLAEVRDRVTEEWRKQEVSRALAEKARALADRIDGGAAPAAVATEAGLQVSTATDIARGQAKDGIDASAISRIFATPVGKASSAPSGEDGRVVFKVTGASAPPFVTTTQEVATTEGQLRTLLADDLLSEYIADVQRRIGVTTYPANVRRAIGGES